MNERVFREHDFIIQESETTAAEGQSSAYQAETERSAQLPPTFVYSSRISPLHTFSEHCRNKFKNITAWNNTSCERFPAYKQVKIYQIELHHKGIYGKEKSAKRALVIPECQQESKSVKETDTTKSYSKAKSRSQQVLSGSSESEVEVQFLSATMTIIIMTTLNAYFAVVYFLNTNVRSGGANAHCAKGGITVTALGTQIMLISFVTCALMVKNMSGRGMSSLVMQ
jgi:hypothetical protein